MECIRWAVFTIDPSRDCWAAIAKNVEAAVKAYPKGFIPVGTAIWLVDRYQAEGAILALIGQLHRYDTPYVLAPLALPPTIHGTEDAVAAIRAAKCDAYAIPTAKPSL